MGLRLVLIAGILSLALASTAGAHELDGSHTDTRRELASVDIAKTVEAATGAADAGGLPTAWCGTERTTDDVTHNAFDADLPQFKLVYAYPSDRGNRFADWRDALQADVSLIGQFMGAQSGGRKAPRFDMGTDCGPENVDVQVVPLPGPRSDYVNDFDALQAAVEARLTHAAGQPRNVVVLADRLSGAPRGYWSGLGAYWVDERPGAQNYNNEGGVFSTLWVPDTEPAPGADPEGWWPEGMLHEMTHNLGAVGANAPHATDYGHCTDGYDVMCYDDGGLPSPLTYGCERILGVMTQVYDCGGDDYFNVAPAGGNYLATHWNVYNNVFLASCASVAGACGGSTSVAPAPPVATADPQVSGTAQAGSALTATPGTWTNSPLSYAYRWERGDGATWAAIAGATGTTYPVTTADVGLRLRVRVIATNGDGSTAAYSPATGVVASASTGSATTSTPATATTTDGGDTGTMGGTTATGTDSGPGVTGSSAPAKGRAALKVAVGRGKGRRLGTIAFAAARGRVTSSRARIRLGKGRYELMLCTTAGASATTPRCARRRITVRRGRAARLPALAVAMPSGVEGRVSYTVTAVRRRFAARTAKRPRLGVALRG